MVTRCQIESSVWMKRKEEEEKNFIPAWRLLDPIVKMNWMVKLYRISRLNVQDEKGHMLRKSKKRIKKQNKMKKHERKLLVISSIGTQWINWMKLKGGKK